MIVDVYEYFKKNPRYNKLVGNGYLFVEYKCPLNIEEFQLLAKSHLITYVINGKKDWLSSNRKYELVEGDALFVRKGVYTTKQYLEEDYCVILFFLTDEFISKFITQNNLHKIISSSKEQHELIFSINPSDSFKMLIDSMFQYLKKIEKIPPSLIEIKFKELLFNIVLDKKNHELVSFFSSVKQRTKVDIENVMMQNFQYDISMKDFARLCERSLSSFKRDFKKYFNTTPSKWLINKRLDYAKGLLLTSNLSVNEICYETGFKNPSHFIRSFKKKYSLPPKQFKIKQFKM